MTDIRPVWERSHPVAIAEVERLRAALKEADETFKRHGFSEGSLARMHIAEALAGEQSVPQKQEE